MTRNDYAAAYQAGFDGTVRFLISQHFSPQAAEELAQDAWTRGWDSLSQLPNDTMIRSWINFIALNLARQRSQPRPIEVSAEAPPMVAISSEAQTPAKAAKHSDDKKRAPRRTVLADRETRRRRHRVARAHR